MTLGDETSTEDDAVPQRGGGPASRPIAVDESVDSFEKITYDASTGIYLARYDPTVDSVSAAVVATVAAASNETTTSLPSLYGSIDPDALDILVTPGSWDGKPSLRRLEFVYAGHRIIIEEPGAVTVVPELDGLSSH